MVVVGNCGGLPDWTHVCGVQLYTSPMWIRVRTHVHASKYMHMRDYSLTVSDSVVVNAVHVSNGCASRVEFLLGLISRLFSVL